MNHPVFLESLYPVLLLAHLGATVVLIGAMTHNLGCVYGYMKGRFGRRHLEKRYAKWLFWSYLAAYVLGGLVYPAYKAYISYPGFRLETPWAKGLFEAKEHWAVFGLLMAAGYYYLRRNFEPQKDRAKLALYVPLCFLLNVAVWYVLIAGCWLVMLKGSWS
jgi:hypothetical protein